MAGPDAASCDAGRVSRGRGRSDVRRVRFARAKAGVPATSRYEAQAQVGMSRDVVREPVLVLES